MGKVLKGKEKKEEIVQVRMLPQDKEKLERIASKNEMSVSTLVRRLTFIGLETEMKKNNGKEKISLIF